MDYGAGVTFMFIYCMFVAGGLLEARGRRIVSGAVGKLFLLCVIQFFSTQAQAANHCIGTVDGAITCSTTAAKSGANLQTAMDSAACGDTIYLEPGGSHYTFPGFAMRKSCPGDNPITVTSGKPEWLPCPTCRATPANLAVMPVLGTTNSCPTLQGVRDGNGSFGNNPPSGWNWVGIGITADYVGDMAVIVNTGGTGASYQCGGGTSTYYIQNENDAPNHITFDRCLFWNRFTDLGHYAPNLIFAHGRNITIKNSFIWPLYGVRDEAHAIALLTGPGPTTYTNNFISATSIPFFTGGAAADYAGGQAGSLTTTYNFLYKPWKWYPPAWNLSGGTGNNGYGGSCTTPGVGDCYATANPYPNDYNLNLARHGGTFKWGCMKNLGEYKLIDGATHKYNVHEFQPEDGGGNCGSQSMAMTLTPRASLIQNPVAASPGTNSGSTLWMDSTYPGPGVGSLTSTGTAFSWQSACGDGGPPIPYCGTPSGWPLSAWINPGHGVCNQKNAWEYNTGFALNTLYFECHRVTDITHHDVTGATPSTGMLGQAFSADLNHPSTTLSAGIDASTLTIPVASTEGWAPYMYAKVDNEYVSICGVGASSLTVCTGGRGFDIVDHYTDAASHSSGVTIQRATAWHWLPDQSTWRNVEISNNVFRNVASGFSILLKDRYGWASEDPAGTGRVAHLQIKNNLFYDTVAGMKKNFAIKMTASESLSHFQPDKSAEDVVIEHNTFDWTQSERNRFGLVLNADGFPDGLQPKTIGIKVRSNLFPETNSVFGPLPILTSLDNNMRALVKYSDTESTSAWNYNMMPFVNLATCGSVDCTGILTGRFGDNVTWLANSKKLSPAAPTAKAGHDGTDMGANADGLPLIRNLRTIVSNKTALLEFDLAAPVRDAGGTQPCMLDVSTSEEVRSYIGLAGEHWTVPYTNINDLNPAMFKNANESTRGNPLLLPVLVESGHVSWPLGNEAVLTGDDGIGHDLALQPGTQYWGRLMCYGDTQHFTFATAGAATTATSLPVQLRPPAGVTTVEFEYGATAALGSSVSSTVNGSGMAFLSVPAVAGKHIYTRVTYKDSQGNVTYRGAKQVNVP